MDMMTLFGLLAALLIIGFGGIFPSYLRHQPVQRTWVLTLVPISLLVFCVVADGHLLQDPILSDVVAPLITMSIIFGCCWYGTNLLDGIINKVHIKKGDLEIKMNATVPTRLQKVNPYPVPPVEETSEPSPSQ